MPTIALHAPPTGGGGGRLVGYLMIAGAASISDGPIVRDCVILPVPTDAALLDQPLLAAIEPWLNDERVAQVVCRAGRATIHIALSPEDKLVLEVDLAGIGTWRLDPDAAAVGSCHPAALGAR